MQKFAKTETQLKWKNISKNKTENEAEKYFTTEITQYYCTVTLTRDPKMWRIHLLSHDVSLVKIWVTLFKILC